MTVIINDVKDNLFVQSILSLNLAELDTYDINNPDPNSKLLNRVRKLSDDERKELKNGLTEISTRINAQIIPPFPPQDRGGLYALILGDDGTKAKAPCCLSALIRKIKNLFGRVRSVDLVKLLTITRADLINKGYEPAPFDCQKVLEDKVKALKEQIKAEKPEEAINGLVNRLIDLDKKFSIAAKNNWYGPRTFLGFIASLNGLVDDIAVLIPGIKAEMAAHFQVVIDVICDRTLDKNAFKTKYGNTIITFFKDIGYADWQLKQMDKSLDESNESVIAHFIVNKINSIKLKLIGVAASHKAELMLLTKRLDNYKSNIVKMKANIDKAQREDAVKGKQAHILPQQKILQNYEEICSFFSDVNSMLSGPNKKLTAAEEKAKALTDQGNGSEANSSLSEATANALKAFKNVVASVCVNIAGDPNLKGLQNIQQQLLRLKDVCDDDFADVTKKIHLAGALNQFPLIDGTDLSVLLLDGRVFSALKENEKRDLEERIKITGSDLDRLRLFVANKGKHAFDDKSKIDCIRGCFTYWTVLFNKLKKDKADEVNKTKKEVQEIEEGKTKFAVDTEALLPSSSAAPSAPSSPPPPLSGLPYLLQLRMNLERHLYNAPEAENLYNSVVAGANGITEPMAKAVYGNFYWILKEGKFIWGDKDSNGHSTDDDWGKKVFLGEIKIPENTPNPTDFLTFLNICRCTALDQVVRRQVRNDQGKFENRNI